MPDKNEKSKETLPIIIIGAGIAGLCISFYLNKKKHTSWFWFRRRFSECSEFIELFK